MEYVGSVPKEVDPAHEALRKHLLLKELAQKKAELEASLRKKLNNCFFILMFPKETRILIFRSLSASVPGTSEAPSVEAKEGGWKPGSGFWQICDTCRGPTRTRKSKMQSAAYVYVQTFRIKPCSVVHVLVYFLPAG